MTLQSFLYRRRSSPWPWSTIVLYVQVPVGRLFPAGYKKEYLYPSALVACLFCEAHESEKFLLRSSLTQICQTHAKMNAKSASNKNVGNVDERVALEEAALVLLSLTPGNQTNLENSDCYKQQQQEAKCERRNAMIENVNGYHTTGTHRQEFSNENFESRVRMVPISDGSPLSNSKSFIRRKVSIDQSFFIPINGVAKYQHQLRPPLVVSFPENGNSTSEFHGFYNPTVSFDEIASSLNNNSHSGLVSCSSSVIDNNSVASHSDCSEALPWYVDQSYVKSRHPPQQQQQQYYTGSTSLAMKEDEESLSPLHCFMRRYCVEAFTATEADVSNPRYGRSHGRNIEVGQVGIQCIHCKHLPYTSRQERAVCFPSSLKNIYHSIETWQRRHSLVCLHIPNWTKSAMLQLMSRSRSGAGGRRHYWEEAAQRLGMVDTENGIRFISPPGTVVPIPQQGQSNFAVEAPQQLEVPVLNHHHPVVTPEDKDLVTDYLFKLLQQMQVCHFAEQDRTGGRSKVKDCPIGYPGLQCKHCAGKAGFGRYFPISIQALTSANSDRNVFNHIMKCRKCPEDIKRELDYYMKRDSLGKNRRGSRKLFFRRVWDRMHGIPPTSRVHK